MNVTLSSRHAVHFTNGTNGPACMRSDIDADAYRTTARPVTCKKCLKLIATEANGLGYVANPSGPRQGGAPVDERTETRLTLEEALAEADWIRNDDTCVGLPNWPRPTSTATTHNDDTGVGQVVTASASPTVTDPLGRFWTKIGRDAYLHDGCVFTRDMVVKHTGYPSQGALNNPNYDHFCDTCLDGRVRHVDICKPEWGCEHVPCRDAFAAEAAERRATALKVHAKGIVSAAAYEANRVAEIEAAGPVIRCCVCKSAEVAYRNTYGQPFCTPCANGDRPAPDDAKPSPITRKLRQWAYAAGHIESEVDGAVSRMKAAILAEDGSRAAEIESEVQRRVASTFRELMAVMGHVTADPKTRVLSGRRSDLKRLEEAGLATLNGDGDLVLS